MNAKRIIPCLDIKNGRVVKGVNFVNLRDAGDPVEIAREYNKAGADELVFLDITATTDARNIVKDLGDANILILRNHGIVACGQTIGGAFLNIFTLIRACTYQVLFPF